MNNTIKISPMELQSIINAAMFEISRNPKQWPIALKKTEEIYKWLMNTIWDNPEKTDLIIMERPF